MRPKRDEGGIALLSGLLMLVSGCFVGLAAEAMCAIWTGSDLVFGEAVGVCAVVLGCLVVAIGSSLVETVRDPFRVGWDWW